MKRPFDLEAAKRGEPVETKAGTPVRLVCFDAKCAYPIIGLESRVDGEELQSWALNGRFLTEDGENDLVMAIKKVTLWVNVYKSPDGALFPGLRLCDSPEDAKDETQTAAMTGWTVIATCPIEVEL